jgi:phosphohistidine swiveling domain-containing protein
MTDWIYMQRKTHCYLTPFIEVIGDVYVHHAREVWFGKSFEDIFITSTKGVMTWYAQKSVVDNLFKFVSEKVLENPSLLKESYEKFLPEIKKLTQLSEKINKLNLKNLDNKEVWALYKNYIDQYALATVYGEPLPLVTKDIVLQHIKKQFNIKEKSIINELTTVLSTPPNKSFIRKEEEELLEIAIKIQEQKLDNFENNQDVMKELQQHQKKYCWIPYDYGVITWDLKHFITTLKNVLKKDCKTELKNKLEEFKDLEEKQKRLVEKHSVSKEIQELFEYVRLATYMMDYKKELFTKSHYLIIPIIDELATRFNTNNILVRLMNNQEIGEGLLQGNIIQEEELKQRFKLSVYTWGKNINGKFLLNEEIDDFIKKHIEDNPEEEKGTKLHGTCASVGKCRGKVKVVMSAMHITKIEEGDILIAPMTSPDYVVGMKKAGAIVTDEGGITCHAAIISRELKIPCVVGTGKATKTFQDGDLVEVNANHASIRLVERK